MKTKIFTTMTILLISAGCFCSCAETGSDGQRSTSTGTDNLKSIGTDDFDAADYDNYYWFGEKKISLQKMDGKFYVLFNSANENKFKDECAKAGLALDDVRATRDLVSFVATGKEGQGAKKFTNLMVASVEGSYEKALPVLSTALYWSPFYRADDGMEIQITEMFTVILKQETDLAQLESLTKKNLVEMIGMDEYNSGWYHLACTNLSKGNALQMANLFCESGLFESAFPNLIANARLD